VLYFREAKAEMTSTLGPVPSYTRYPRDDKLIACALAGGAEVVITVNEDTLALGSLMNVQM
jgi:predicted nucleic acid-binding protein